MTPCRGTPILADRPAWEPQLQSEPRLLARELAPSHPSSLGASPLFNAAPLSPEIRWSRGQLRSAAEIRDSPQASQQGAIRVI